MNKSMRIVVACAALLLSSLVATAESPAPTAEAATRAAYLDSAGVVRWRDNNQEVALFGANYCIMSGSDYRMAGLVSQDRKKMIDEDMAQFARMGWTALRLCSWGDWENADKDGNLVVNDHVDLMDYLIAKARERGIYILLTPIHTYNPAFADQLNAPTQNTGFSRYYDRSEMGTNPKSIAAQANYIGQLLNHVNPYTGVALKDEPAILFIEVINEPVHHPEDLPGSVAYINRLVKAVRDTGCTKITFFNVSQDFAIAPAIRQSNVDGVSFGWYPSGLVAGHTLKGNFLQAVDSYPDMLRPELNGKPRIVYEFDTADLATGYMYPAMARTYRSVGAQFASMFAYDMLETAPFNLGWQTHFLNLVHSPRKAVSAVIAAEAMRRLPRFQSYGRYADDRSFGDFRVSYEDDMSELNAEDAYMNAGDTTTLPRDPTKLTRVVGLGSSPIVAYEGTGAYFLDKVRDGVWRLEVYPDEALVRDPFEQPRPDKVVSRLLYRTWPMQVHLPDLGDRFTASVVKLPQGSAATQHAENSQFEVQPGIWLLSRDERANVTDLPARIDRVGFDEYHVNQPVSYPDLALPLTPGEFRAGHPVAIRVRVPDNTLPDAVRLWLHPAGVRMFSHMIPMRRERGDTYVAMPDASNLPPGLYEFAVSIATNNRVTTFPGAIAGEPGDWPFQSDAYWKFRIVTPDTQLRLLDPKNDYDRLSFVRPGEQYRQAFFRIEPGDSDDESALRLILPDLGKDTPERYAASLYVGDSVAARAADAPSATAVGIRLRSVGGARKTVDVTLIEKDGTGWRTSVVANSGWSSVLVPLQRLSVSRSILIPSPFPGLWNYWREIPAHRGGAGDHIHVADVERLELSVHRNEGAAETGSGVSIQSVWLTFKNAK